MYNAKYSALKPPILGIAEFYTTKNPASAGFYFPDHATPGADCRPPH